MGSSFTISADAVTQVGRVQWDRRIKLVVGDDAGNAIDLSDLQVRFTVTSATATTLKRLEARIYNPAPETSRKIEKEFTRVELSVGYAGLSQPSNAPQGNLPGHFESESPLGLIFTGSVTQVRRGKENAVDRYLDIIGQDGDRMFNFATMNQPVAANSTIGDRFNQVLKLLQPFGVTRGSVPDLNALNPTKFPRGVAMQGMARDVLRDLAKSLGCDWCVEDGKINLIPYDSVLPGGAIILDPTSGMIDAPEQTIDGLVVRCLMNYNVKPGRVIQVPKELVNTDTIKLPITANDYVPDLSANDQYKCYAVVHSGDTRGNEWSTTATCEALDPTTGKTVASQKRNEAVS